ncbi:MAG: methionyl-tRNA formyltransferase [Roseibacillus sp.]|nr:methionyl-tRNA formyltransferase [Roseibacillus sp.]
MRILFMGTGEIALPVFRRLAKRKEMVGLVTQPDRPFGRSSKPRPPIIKQEAKKLSIPILQPEDVRRAEEIAAIRDLKPELIVVMAYGQILPAGLLRIPRLGCINIHASLLPRHRGASCIQAAISAGDLESGISIIKMVERLDAGDVLIERSVPLHANETGGSLHDRLSEIAPDLLMEYLETIETDEVEGIPQDHALATYAPQLQRLDGQVDWGASAGILERRIRAFEPWPGSYTNFTDDKGRNRRLKVFPGVGLIKELEAARPGEIVRVEPEGISVACGRGGLMLNNLQIEGGKRLPAAELIRGNSIVVGRCFFSLASEA